MTNKQIDSLKTWLAATITKQDGNIMAKTIRTKVYTFTELDADAQRFAIDTYRMRGGDDGDYYSSEITASVVALCNAFDLKTGRTYADVYPSSYWENAEGLSGVRLAKWIYNNYRNELYKPKYLGCVAGKARYSNCQVTPDYTLTGMCYDMDVLAPIYELIRTGAACDVDMLMNDISHAIEKVYQDAADYVNSDGYIADMFTANDYLFTKDGREFNY